MLRSLGNLALIVVFASSLAFAAPSNPILSGMTKKSKTTSRI